MQEPKQRPDGLWYIEDSNYGFATKKDAFEGLQQRLSAPADRRKAKATHRNKRIILVICAALAFVISVFWWRSGAESRAEKTLIATQQKAELLFKRESLLLCQKTISATAVYGRQGLSVYTEGRVAGGSLQFLWPQGAFYFKNGFGVEVPQSARCEVNLKTGKISYLVVSGQVIVK